MSECVVRMEMPKACSWIENGEKKKCPTSEWGGACAVTKQFKMPDDCRPSWCPIICQLPEGHGRLVDADAYSAEMKDRQNAAWKWRNEAIGEEDEVKLARAEGAFTAFVEAKLTWDKQATIVPAEAERRET